MDEFAQASVPDGQHCFSTEINEFKITQNLQRSVVNSP